MPSMVEVDEIHEKTADSGVSIKDDLKLSSGNAIKNASGVDLLTEAGALGSSVVFPAGHVLQVKSAVVTAYSLITAAIPNDDSKPQIGEGSEVIRIDNIQASHADNYFLIIANVSGSPSANDGITVALFKDTGADAIAAVGVGAIDKRTAPITLIHKIQAGSTAEIDFSITAGCTWANFRVNSDTTAQRYDGVYATTLTIFEIKGAI